jgi:uncharacterized FlgJ-related protein
MKKLLFITMLLLSSMVIGKVDGAKKDLASFIQEWEIRQMKTTTFSVDNLVRYLTLTGAPDPKMMVSQFIVETGWFKSKLFTKGNNICGMKLAKKRQTTATGTMYGYASFAHWTDSVDDFLLWLKYHNLSNGYFDQVQKKGYSENSQYCQLVLKVHKQLKINLA